MVNSLNGVRVLVAEDNLINQKIVRIMLQKAGCEVVAVDDGRKACEEVQTNPYDLVLMDLHMPAIDGLEATRMIRNLAGKVKDIPILALTASAFKEDRDRCLGAGMNDFITKPIRLELLIERCNHWARKPAIDSIEQEAPSAA